MYRGLIIFLFILFFLSNNQAQVPNNTDNIKQSLSSAYIAYEADHLFEAEKIVQQLWAEHQTMLLNQDKTLAIEVLYFLGRIQSLTGKMEASIQHCLDASQLAQSLNPESGELRIKTLVQLVESYIMVDQTRKARQVLEANLPWASKFSNVHWLADLYERSAFFLDLDGDKETASYYYQQARLIRAKHPNLPPRERHKTTMQAALRGEDFGDTPQSRTDSLLKALNILESNLPNGGKLWKYYIYKGLGRSYLENGENNLAINYLLQGEKLLETLQLNTPIYLADLYADIARCYHQKKDYLNEEKYLQLEEQLSLKLPGTKIPFLKAILYQNKGLLYSDTEKYEAAKQCFSISLEAAQAALKETAGTELIIATIYNSQADLAYLQRDYELAIQQYKALIQYLTAQYGSNSRFLIQPYNNLGLVYFNLKEYQKAYECYTLALPLTGYDTKTTHPYEQIINIQSANNILFNIAENYGFWYNKSKDQSMLYKSVEYYERCLSFADYLRMNYRSEGSKALLNAEQKSTFEHLLTRYFFLQALTDEKKIPERAFLCAEKSRALSLLENIRSNGDQQFAGIPIELSKQERFLTDTLRKIEARLERFNNHLSASSEKVKPLESQFFLFKTEYNKLVSKIQKEYPDYFYKKYGVDPPDLDLIRQTLRKDSTSLVAFFVGEPLTFRFVITPDTFAFDFIIGGAKLKNQVGRFIEKLKAPEQALANSPNTTGSMDSLGVSIYNSLFDSIGALLSKKIIIIPDGYLGYLPFEALLTRPPVVPNKILSYPFLIKKHQIGYAYSIATWWEMRNPLKRQTVPEKWLGVAPSYNQPLGSPSNLQRVETNPLRYALAEVNTIRNITNGNLLIGNDASVERFLQQLNQYSTIHFAGHAKANDRDGNSGYLVLSKLDGSKPDNSQFLYTRELYRTKVPADMVVLSACETGTGQLQKGEGIISLARAFAYAGAKSIITSVWSVDDESTQKMFTDFYTTLKSGASKAQALHAAKLKLFEGGGKYSHPYFWAGFIGIGDLR